MSGGDWLAAYLYYAEPWEPMLKEAVEPLVQEMLEEGHAERFFFIRYWERGPHIRLRFFGDRAHMDREIVPALERQIGDFMARKPSRRFDADEPDSRLEPNNSIQYVVYEPEIVRYGGPHGIGIAERQFESSSRAVLCAIDDPASWGYEKGLGTAIQMHLCMAHAFGMDLEMLNGFCSYIARGWIRRAYRWDETTTADEHRTRREEIHTAFAQMFDHQKEVLVPFARVLWQGLEEDAVFENEWLNAWIREMREIRELLADVVSAGQIEVDEQVRAYLSGLLPGIAGQELWSIQESYVHMTNNRLGILNQDEAYLGFLIGETIPYLRGEKTI